MHRPLFALALIATLPPRRAPAGPDGPGGIPVSFNLERAGRVTLVVEDAAGRRVRNLVAETPLAAGPNTVVWDGYDEGARDDNGNVTRRRVAAGEYRVRGLVHDGIHLVYEFSVNSPGTPPWFTADRSGGWMSDHLVPNAAAFIPAGAGSPYGGGAAQVALCSILAENGDPIVLADSAGRKLYGDHFFGWDGGVALAFDAGPAPRDDVFLYVLFGSEPDELALRALTKTAKGGTEIVKFKTRNKLPHEPISVGLSVAVRDGLAAVSVPGDDSIVFVDARKKAVIGTASVPSPRGLWFGRDGKLDVVSGTTVKRFDLTRDSGGVPKLSNGRDVITAGLEEPYALTQDGEGNLLVTDLGRSHQVKAFDASGKLLRTIGRPGGLQLGRYDPLRMQRPTGVAVDEKGQVWVAECDALPKRVSVWSGTGELAFAKYGPPIYGGGGTIDPADPTRFFVGQYGNVMEFELDWAAGASKLKNVCVRRPLMGAAAERWQPAAPERPVHVGRHTYLVGTYQGQLRGNDNSMIFKVGDDGVAWPVAFVGGPRWWVFLEKEKYRDVYDRMPKGVHEDRVLMAWSDLNGDHAVQADEFQFRAFDETYVDAAGQTHRPDYFVNNLIDAADLSMTAAWSLKVPAPKIRDDGVPVYDLGAARFLMAPRAEFNGGDVGMPTWPTPQGWLLTWQGGEAFRWGEGWRDGRRMWTYPQVDGETTPQHPGHMVAATRLMGPVFRPPAGDAGEIFALNGEKGNMYLMTADGLFLQTLGGDERLSPLLRLPEARRGMRVDGFSFAGEDFHNTVTQTAAGAAYVVAGHEHASIFRLEGLETVRRVEFGLLDVGAEALAGLPQTRVERARKQGRQTLAVALRGQGPKVDGDLSDWPATTAWAPIGDRASGAVVVAGDRLYAAWKTSDPGPLENAGGDFRYLFKRGGALDLMLGGDPSARPKDGEPAPLGLRLLVTRVDGKPRAVLYRQAAPGAPAGEGVTFKSPVGEARFDSVTDVSARVDMAQSGGDYEVAVPLSLLGLAPRPGKVLGDLGMLRGSAGTTVRRTYWNNLNTSIVSDVPSEARLQPGNWGVFDVAGER